MASARAFVFAADGKLLRTMAPDFGGKADTGNLHGLMLREEGGKEFLYGALNKAAKVVKLALDGTVVWTIPIPNTMSPVRRL